MKYKYNPKTLSYEEVRFGFWRRLLQIVLIASPSVLLGLLLSLLFSDQLNVPKEKSMQRELSFYKAQLERLQQDVELSERVLLDFEQKDRDLYRVALYAEKLPDEVRIMGAGGGKMNDDLDGFSYSELIKNIDQRADNLKRRLYGQSLSYQQLLKLAKDKEKMLECIPAIQPVRNSDLKRLASGFGWRIDPIYKTRKMHTGMDFTADKGTEVYATGNGVIETVESSFWGYGRCIVINHGFGYKTRYAHLNAFKVKEGQKIRRGELIGFVGNTGKSTGPHLHYEVEKNGEKVNPVNYYHSDLSPEQYEKLLEMSQQNFKALD